MNISHAEVSIPSAQGIIALCDNEDQRSQSFCAGYLSSIIHTLTLTPSGLCLPEDASSITIRRVYDIVSEELRRSPESLNQSAIQVVARAMSNAYPCSGAASSGQNPPATPPAKKVKPAPRKSSGKSDFPE